VFGGRVGSSRFRFAITLVPSTISSGQWPDQDIHLTPARSTNQVLARFLEWPPGEASERSFASAAREKRYEEGFIESRWPQVVGKASKATDSGNGSQAAKAYAETGCRKVYGSAGPLQAS
jgi:hypothetical protein